MAKLHKDYYLRKSLLERNEVPSITDMKKEMGQALVNVYFQTMSPQHKLLAGLNPPLKGGGKDWYIPPKDLLNGRAVLKPIQKQCLSKLSCNGIMMYGEKFIEDYFKQLENEKQKLLLEGDLNWQEVIDRDCEVERIAASIKAEGQNTMKIKEAFHEFTVIYQTSITKIEAMLSDAGLKEIQRVKEKAIREISINFNILLRQQSKILNSRYKEKLEAEKNISKDRFIDELQKSRINFHKELQEIHFQKHVAVEKLRTLLEYQNLACQVYVALKERIECNKCVNISKYNHEKAIKKISDKITMKDFEIRLAREKELKQNECNRMWHKKVCHVVKRFQEFVKYCLSAMPDHADFFINMEKLMLLQLSDVLDNPSAESIFDFDNDDKNQTPTPSLHPFYLVCDEGAKPQLDPNLCSKRCTCGISELPIIVVNKRCMYAACDNYDLFIDEVKQFLDGKRGNEDDFIDDHDYTYDVPIECSLSDQFKELQLESSLMQILQNALPNVKRIPSKCQVCNNYYCFCTSQESKMNTQEKAEEIESLNYAPSGDKITQRTDELKHIREPKIDSYLDYILPINCKCAIIKKKQLRVHLPAYMRNISKFETVDIPDYETCKLDDLKHLVHKSHKIKPEIVSSKEETKIKDAYTQYSDPNYDDLCNRYSDDELQNVFKQFNIEVKCDKEKSKPLNVFGGSFSTSHLEKQPSYFALETALKLKEIIRKSPELEEVFKQKDCVSEDNGV